MKCNDCAAGGQHDYGENFVFFDANGNLQIGRVYPSSEPFQPQLPLEGIMLDATTMLVINHQPQRKGWICPKCDNAVSPDEKTCPHCKPKPKKESDDDKRTHITE